MAIFFCEPFFSCCSIIFKHAVTKSIWTVKCRNISGSNIEGVRAQGKQSRYAQKKTAKELHRRMTDRTIFISWKLKKKSG